MGGGNWVKPTIAIPKEVNVGDPVWSEETFAPILTVGVFDELEEAIEWNNGVPQVRLFGCVAANISVLWCAVVPTRCHSNFFSRD